MNTISTEVIKASVSAHASQAEPSENTRAANEDVYNGQESSYDNCNGSPFGRSRYGRMLKPTPTMSSINLTQVLYLLSYLMECLCNNVQLIS